MLTLEIQICTFGQQGLDRVGKMKLPIIDDVFYTVSLQNPNNEVIVIPDTLQRSDLKIFEHKSIGLSNNRNYALSIAKGDLILIADDDLEYSENGLKQIIASFEANDSLDFATFKYLGPDNKYYPLYSFEIVKKFPQNYSISSIEICLRRKILDGKHRFSPLLGIGSSEFGAAEESVFIWHLINSGKKGRFFPVNIAIHQHLTTGNRKATNNVLKAQGLWLWVRYGYFEGFLRLLRDVPRKNASNIRAFCQMTIGFFKASKFFNRDGSEK